MVATEELLRTEASLVKKVRWIPGKRTPQERRDTSIDFEEAVKTGRFEDYAKMMQNGILPRTKFQVTDTEGNGLRALIRISGSVSYHCHWLIAGGAMHVDGDIEDTDDELKSRPHLTIGHYPSTPVKEVRELAATIYKLGQMGVDVRLGLHYRLLRELKAKGIKWRLPNL